MKKFAIKVEWTQYMSHERVVECDTLEEAVEIATSFDPNSSSGLDVVAGDVISDVEAFVDGVPVG